MVPPLSWTNVVGVLSWERNLRIGRSWISLKMRRSIYHFAKDVLFERVYGARYVSYDEDGRPTDSRPINISEYFSILGLRESLKSYSSYCLSGTWFSVHTINRRGSLE